MSPTDASRFTDAATPSHPAEHLIPPPPGGDHTSTQDGAAGEGAQATDPRPPGPVTPARARPSLNAHPHSYNDPSNYLG